jgi:hypothetical protein
MHELDDDLSFRPFTVLLGIILGSLFAIAFCTGIVGLVFWLVQDESPRLNAELPKLIEITGIFVVLTLLAAGSFVGSVKRAGWRYWLLAGLWVGLLLTGSYYWP